MGKQKPHKRKLNSKEKVGLNGVT
ncbi:uncharacterized protein G2W53_000826 [Senna tora]|uniref:Uncharacterized protein n=1 Tax=Senna tora TaxID=362788 RepID=A0A834XH99_9FABA|nr:uncharacterized protein G2W53_000826 [Senna tora]